jgi:hypothetical protein
MSRSTYLLVSQINTLDTWGKELENMFPVKMKVYGTYIVGSAVQHKDWRDVDIRQIVSDADFEKLKKVIDIGYFNHMVSIWGQQITGLPIDYQVQGIGHEDNKNSKGYHHPIGLRDGYVNGEKRV